MAWRGVAWRALTNPIKHRSHRHPHRLPRVESLSGEDTYPLDPPKGKCRLGEHLPEAQKTGERDGREVFESVVEGLLAPVFPACVDAVDAAEIGNEAEQNQRDEHEDLDPREEELDLAVAASVRQV